MKRFKFTLVAVALLASSLIRSQTIYYTAHLGAWNDNTAWSTVGIGGVSCSCSPGCTSLSAVVYIGNSIISSNCLSGIGSNAVITIESGDTLTVTVSTKLLANNSTINILSGGVMIVNGEMDIAVGDTINNSGTLTINGNVSDTGTGAYLTGTGVFGSTGTVTGTTVFVNPQGLWQAVKDSTIDTSRTNLVYNKGFVGIGTLNPTKPLHVNGSAIISDTLNVAAVQSHRIALFPGDSLIRFGDSSVVINMKNNNIYGELPCQPNCTNYTNIALGVNNNFQRSSLLSCALGLANNILGANSIVIGQKNNAANNNTICIGNNLNNNIPGSIIMGGFASRGGTPALSIIPDITNNTAGFVGIGTTTPDAVFSILSNPSIRNQLSITSSSEDVFTVDQSGNTFAAGNVTVANQLLFGGPLSPGPSISMFGGGQEISPRPCYCPSPATPMLFQSCEFIFAGIPPLTVNSPLSNNTFVGIGTSAPDAGLSISTDCQNEFSVITPGNTTDVFTIDPNGNTYAAGTVGIGTTSPSEKLDVSGADDAGVVALLENSISNVRFGTNMSSGAYNWNTQTGDNGIIWTDGLSTINGGQNLSSGFVIAPWAGSNAGIRIEASGNVGIGTSQPAYALDVNGTIRANEVLVCLFGTCDFVFDKDYNLMPLNDLEKYLQLNHHLPGIPSAKDMQEEGNVSLGKMNSQLLQKVEELSLYMIQLNKEVKALEADNEKLKEAIEKK